MPLFGKKKTENQAKPIQTAAAQNETSYFGKNLTIKGRVSGNGNIIILGSLDGEFNLRGWVKIAQPAEIKGKINATLISVNGRVRGIMNAQKRLHMDQTARIEGQITTPKLSISEGASFDGKITMGGRLAKPSKPAVAESIRSSQSPPEIKKK